MTSGIYYSRIPNVVDKEQCAKTVEEIKGFLKSACKISMHDARTWEKWPMSTHGFGECYSLPTMWENRQNPRVYEVFSALLEETKLWVSVDRVGSKRPGTSLPPPPNISHQSCPGVLMVDGQPVEKREWHRDAFVHTDCNLWHPPKSLQIQGVSSRDDATQLYSFHSPHFIIFTRYLPSKILLMIREGLLAYRTSTTNIRIGLERLVLNGLSPIQRKCSTSSPIPK